MGGFLGTKLPAPAAITIHRALIVVPSEVTIFQPSSIFSILSAC